MHHAWSWGDWAAPLPMQSAGQGHRAQCHLRWQRSGTQGGHREGPWRGLGVSGGALSAVPGQRTREHRGPTHGSGLWELQPHGGWAVSPGVGLRWGTGQAGAWNQRERLLECVKMLLLKALKASAPQKRLSKKHCSRFCLFEIQATVSFAVRKLHCNKAVKKNSNNSGLLETST